MKKLKKILSILLSCFLMLCMSVGCAGCSFKELFAEEPTFTYGDFRCCYVRSAESSFSVRKDIATGVNVFDLVEDAQEKETVVVPENINGLPVIAIGRGGFGWTNFLRGRYKKIYLPSTLLHIYDISRSISRRKVFLLDKYEVFNKDNREVLLKKVLPYANARFFVSESLYQEYRKLEGIDRLDCIQIANLTYIIDKEFYWIDDYNNGDYIVPFTVPIKPGFAFDGWYKDEKYIRKFDIETDRYINSEDASSVKLYGKFVLTD
ncbi:MAG: InlB B-repeat-containing protein [Clostridia bacterium]|nr:InlB B-repeat-containing protein [Clostridia bacterium]